MKKYSKVYLEITNICNMHCSFCHGTKRKKEFMTEERFRLALDRLKGITDYLYFHVLGEPLCHPNIIKYIEKAGEEGFKVSLTTNGTLLSEELLNTPIYKVSVSLHSIEEGDRESYLEKVCDFSEKAKEGGILISLRLWNKGTDADNSYTEEYLRKRFPSRWKEGRRGSFTLSQGIYLEYANRFTWPDMGEEEKREKFCYGLRDQFGVLVDGSVVPCCLDAEGDITLGNIFLSPIEEILNSEKAEKILKGFDKREAVEELCRKCKYAERF